MIIVRICQPAVCSVVWQNHATLDGIDYRVAHYHRGCDGVLQFTHVSLVSGSSGDLGCDYSLQPVIFCPVK